MIEIEGKTVAELRDQPGNVRWDTYRAQNENRRPRNWRGKTSRYEGVHLTKWGKWQAQLPVGARQASGRARKGKGVKTHLGFFANETDAAIAWNTHVAYLGLDRELNEIRAEDYIHD